MNYVKLIFDGQFYNYDDGHSIEMVILGRFLSSDVRFRRTIYKEWALADKEDPNGKFTHCCGGNITFLEEKNDHIYLTDKYSEEEPPTALKMSRKQFVQILNNWWEKVCETKPKEVIIKHGNDQFIIETTN